MELAESRWRMRGGLDREKGDSFRFAEITKVLSTLAEDHKALKGSSDPKQKE